MTFVQLNNVDHQNIRVRSPRDCSFEAGTLQTLAFAPEFSDLQRHYPIIFRRSIDGVIRPVAVLGLAEKENLFIDDGGNWRHGTYIPAGIQRGPFALALTDDEPPRVLIDLEHPCVSREAGESLFLEQGGNTRFLDGVITTLGLIFAGERQADALIAAFEAAGLLQPANLQVRVSEDEIYAISNVLIVTDSSLQTLSEDALLGLHRSGFLTHAIHAASSLNNLQRLADLKASRTQADKG